MERNRISSLQSHGKALEKECCLPGIFCDSGDTPANLLCQLNGHLMPCTSCFYGKWVKDVCAGQFGVFVYLVLRCLLGCCTWFSCCVANVGLSILRYLTSTNIVGVVLIISTQLIHRLDGRQINTDNVTSAVGHAHTRNAYPYDLLSLVHSK